MATATKPKLSFNLPCPKCGEDTSILLDLNDLAGEVECRDCDSTFGVAEAIELLNSRLERWQGLQRWLATAKQFFYDVEF